jgi:hypothetical protein
MDGIQHQRNKDPGNLIDDRYVQTDGYTGSGGISVASDSARISQKWMDPYE